MGSQVDGGGSGGVGWFKLIGEIHVDLDLDRRVLRENFLVQS